ncbi:universal stress protein [Methanosphaera sp.]
MFNRILVPTDGSELSKKAAKEAIELAKNLDSTIIVTHIMDQKVPLSYEEQEDRANKYIKEIIDLAIEDDVKAESMLLFGSPEFDIEKVARKSEADVIVMGSRGSGLKSKLLGSFTQATLKHVDLPIIIIK